MSDRKFTPVSEWKWFGSAGHLCVGRWCRFHLCTLVGDYLVSTVGGYWPERGSREIHAKIHDPEWFAANVRLKGDTFDSAYMKRFGYEKIGCDRSYETMVFIAGHPCSAEGCNCGMPSIASDEKDYSGYNDAAFATKGHYELCAKWAALAKAEAPNE